MKQGIVSETVVGAVHYAALELADDDVVDMSGLKAAGIVNLLDACVGYIVEYAVVHGKLIGPFAVFVQFALDIERPRDILHQIQRIHDASCVRDGLQNGAVFGLAGVHIEI